MPIGENKMIFPTAHKQPPGLRFWITPEYRASAVGENVLYPPPETRRLYDWFEKNSGTVFLMSKRMNGLIEDLIVVVQGFPGKNRVMAESSMKALATLLFIEVLEADRVPEVSRPDDVVAAGVRYIEEHWTEKISTEALVTYLGYSRRWIFNAFEAATGMPPHQYLERYRIGRAKQLLLSGDSTVTDVAFDCAFNSSQHFAKSFKRITGLTPTQFRKNAGADAQQL